MQRPRFSPASRDTAERIAQEIRAYIQENDLRPGARIGTESQIAGEFGVSRPTLREALRLLASSHLIRATRGPGGGIFVASTANEGFGRNLSESIATMLAARSTTLRELLETRMVLEVPLAGMAARHADEQTARELEQAIDDASGHDPGSDEFRLADARFHRIVAAAAGNDLLIGFTDWALDVLQPSLVEYIGTSLDGEEILAQHRRILRAIQRNQPAAAERAMRSHLQHLFDVLEGLEESSS